MGDQRTPRFWGVTTFRNFREFNLAMLGKQGWKLINKPESLTAKLLKARYYKNGEFFSARLGYKPSFVWCGIWSPQQVLKSGCRGRIGDGRSIDVWLDPWLREDGNFKLETPTPHDLTQLRVHGLWIPNHREWDVELLG